LGFEQVFDYVAGKADWMASGLPIEGSETGKPRAGDLVRRDVPTCRLDERVTDVRRRVGEVGWDVCIVANERNVVLGRLRQEHMEEAASEDRVEDVMEAGPGTIRPSEPLDELVERLRERDLTHAIVTTSAGMLLGVLLRAEAERALA